MLLGAKQFVGKMSSNQPKAFDSQLNMDSIVNLIIQSLTFMVKTDIQQLAYDDKLGYSLFCSSLRKK